MQVNDAMSTEVLTIGPAHTLREAAARMSSRKVGAAVVIDGDQDQPGILTERDILDAIGAGQDVDEERVQDHLTNDIVVAAPDWPLEKAAAASPRSEEHTSELQSPMYLVCRLLLEKKKKKRDSASGTHVTYTA